MYSCYCAWEIFGGGKFWRTMQAKAIGKVNKHQSVHNVIVFHVSVNISKENFGKWLMIRQIHQFFPYQSFPLYGIVLAQISLAGIINKNAGKSIEPRYR